MQKEYVNEYIKGNVISFLVDKQAKQTPFSWNGVIGTNKHAQVTTAAGHICTLQLDTIIIILVTNFPALESKNVML